MIFTAQWLTLKVRNIICNIAVNMLINSLIQWIHYITVQLPHIKILIRLCFYWPYCHNGHADETTHYCIVMYTIGATLWKCSTCITVMWDMWFLLQINKWCFLKGPLCPTLVATTVTSSAVFGFSLSHRLGLDRTVGLVYLLTSPLSSSRPSLTV